MYWLVSLPLVEQSQDRTWSLLQEKTCYQNSLSENFKFELPGLRVGTLDSLLALSDDLVKTNISIEGVVNKIRRQLHEMTDGSSETSLSVGGAPVESFLTSFQWDEAKYPSRKPLKELVDSIAENVARIEDDLKTKVAEYNNIRGIVSAATRKAQGSLAARDLSTIVEAKHVVETENLTTIYVIIPKYGLRDWEQQYPKLHQFVVPRSSAVLAEDTEYALVTLVLFKRVLDTVKQELRQKGLQVREYVVSEEQQEDTGTKAEAMKADLAQKRAALEEWCDTSYGEVFGAWVHISGIRLFVESILRYGLPPSFQSGLLKPQRKMEGKLRGVLAQTFGPASSSLWNQEATSGNAGATGLGGEADMYPYVSFTIDVDA